MVGICAEKKDLLAFQSSQQRFMQRRHIQICSCQQSQMAPQSPLALLIGKGVKPCRVHVLHIWTLTVKLLELGEVVLKKLAAVFGSGSSAHSGPGTQQHEVCFADCLSGQFNLNFIGHFLKNVITSVLIGQKAFKARTLLGRTVVKHVTVLPGVLLSSSIRESERWCKYAPFCNLLHLKRILHLSAYYSMIRLQHSNRY